MAVKKWGPLVALLALMAAGVTGLMVQNPKPRYQSQPPKTESWSSKRPKLIVEAASDQNEGKREKIEGWYRPLLEKPTDTLLVIFNGLLTLFTWFLYRATKGLFDETAGLRSAADKQSRDMEASIKAATDAVKNGIAANQISITNAEHQLRAYVTVRDINLISRRKGGTLSATGAIIDGPVHTYELAAILRNGGQTPAVNTTINVSCAEQHIPLADDFGFPDSHILGHGLIGPNSEIFSPPVFVPAHQLERETAGRTWFFWGWVEYDDIFPGSPRHRTEFCFRISRRRLEWTNELVMHFAPDANFNNMDLGCMREFDPQANKYE